MEQRAILCIADESVLLYGDPERHSPRLWVGGEPESDEAIGSALPVLLGEGWRVASVHSLGSIGGGGKSSRYVSAAALVILTRSSAGAYREE